MNLAEQNAKIECLIDWIEEQQAMMKQFPVYTLPEIDLDEGPCNGRDCNECEIGGCDHNV